MQVQVMQVRIIAPILCFDSNSSHPAAAGAHGSPGAGGQSRSFRLCTLAPFIPRGSPVPGTRSDTNAAAM